MKQGVISDATKSSRQLAQDIARKMAAEPLEILKSVNEQVIGVEATRQPDSQASGQPSEQQKQIEEQQKVQDQLRSSRRLEAYQRELEDIRKQDLFRDLQEKISQGIEVPLEDYSELSMEQKQVLNAQMEAVKFQKKQAEFAESQKGGSLFGSSKKSRRMGSNQKQEAEKQQTRVERPVPPSG